MVQRLAREPTDQASRRRRQRPCQLRRDTQRKHCQTNRGTWLHRRTAEATQGDYPALRSRARPARRCSRPGARGGLCCGADQSKSGTHNGVSVRTLEVLPHQRFQGCLGQIGARVTIEQEREKWQGGPCLPLKCAGGARWAVAQLVRGWRPLDWLLEKHYKATETDPIVEFGGSWSDSQDMPLA